ncbi:MAG: DNA alkylation response protein, partial [SAR324 cluster bacterium]|nr:DNA alkylation response protein [SAR324 cluster bacterium]
MIPFKPLTDLPTHEVLNMPPHLGDQDLWMNDSALREGVLREGGGWALDKLQRMGKTFGNNEVFEKAEQANRNPPQMKAFDRY